MTNDAGRSENGLAPDVVEARRHEGGWLVLDGGTPIGYITPDRTVRTPSGAEHTVREGRGAARLWSAEGTPLAQYDREPGLHIRDVASGVTWDLLPDWRSRVAREGDRVGFRLAEIYAEAYTLEQAQGAMPARVKLLLAWLAV